MIIYLGYYLYLYAIVKFCATLINIATLIIESLISGQITHICLYTLLTGFFSLIRYLTTF